MQRCEFLHNNLTFSYLDSGGDGAVVIALHAHWMEGSTFIPLAKSLAPDWRVIALDQRGHGYSDHAMTYTREEYLNDVLALLTHLNVKERVVLLGNSLGGINAYYFAAKFPEMVRAIIIEDIGVEFTVDASFSLQWAGIFNTRNELEECVGLRMLPCLQESFRQTSNGWQLAFDPKEILTSISLSIGNHWNAWLKSDCPALVIRGQESRLTTQEQCEQMAVLRPNTQIIELVGGHVVHYDNPSGFMNAVSTFLNTHCI